MTLYKHTFPTSSEQTQVAVSGGFDPLHPEHLDFFRAARQLGGKLTVVINADAWIKTKHEILLSQDKRGVIISQLRMVDQVVLDNDPTGNVTESLRSAGAHVFAVGPDHADLEALPEFSACQEMGVRIVCLSELKKTLSSSALLGYRHWFNPPVTVSALVCKEGKVLLANRRQDGKWTLPGGFLEVGESLEEGLRREVKEETGCELDHPVYIRSSRDTYSDGRYVTAVTFLAVLRSDPQPSKELVTYLWIDECPPARQFFAQSDWEAVNRYVNRSVKFH